MLSWQDTVPMKALVLRTRQALIGAALLLALLGGCASERPLRTAAEVDLTRYQGTWYEIARLPQWFQRGCVRSRAEYTIIDATTVGVTNRCTQASGESRSATGRAYVVDPETNAKLEVIFDNWFSRLFPSLVRGKYWITYLDPEYRSVLVGHPNREYLWILARSPRLSDSEFEDLLRRARERGFDTEALIVSPDQARSASPASG
jgi:apolipoprotein D and lipocalin family protein